MSQSSGLNQMKEQAKQIMHERIQKSIPILKEMQPRATRSPSVSQPSRSLARVINGRNDLKEIKKFIIAETLQELEFVLKNHT